MPTKKWYESKIVWAAFLGFLFAITGSFGYDAPEGTADTLVNLDWSNLTTAIINAAIIVARVFFTNTRLN